MIGFILGLAVAVTLLAGVGFPAGIFYPRR